jgi:hypothetical protein
MFNVRDDHSKACGARRNTDRIASAGKIKEHDMYSKIAVGDKVSYESDFDRGTVIAVSDDGLYISVRFAVDDILEFESAEEFKIVDAKNDV